MGTGHPVVQTAIIRIPIGVTLVLVGDRRITVPQIGTI